MIHIQDQDTFNSQLRMLIREELSVMVSSIVQTPKEDIIITRYDLMKRFKISPVTLWKRMRDGSIKFHKIGRKVFFRESEIKEIFKSQG